MRDGKMPKSAIQKLVAAYGCIFECGWLPPVALVACTEWVCAGTLVDSNVTFSLPDTWPVGILDDCPIGVLPRKSGSANVVVPLPPYVVPSNENNA